jgi:LPS-assembly protein
MARNPAPSYIIDSTSSPRPRLRRTPAELPPRTCRPEADAAVFPAGLLASPLRPSLVACGAACQAGNRQRRRVLARGPSPPRAAVMLRRATSAAARPRRQAEGDVACARRAAASADRLSYDQAPTWRGARPGAHQQRRRRRYSRPRAAAALQRFEGFFLQPSYDFDRPGRRPAQRIDFLDSERAVATGATTPAARATAGGVPAWLLKTDRVQLDFEANEGIAEAPCCASWACRSWRCRC